MTRSPDSLATLRDQAVAGIEDLADVLALGATLGAVTRHPDEVHPPFLKVGALDPDRMAADSRRLAIAHRAVADHLHRLPEQQVRLGRGWTGTSGSLAVTAVIDHQRRTESDLHVLRTLAEATRAASSGIDQLLRTWYLTVARLSAPLVAGVPVAEVPAAVLSGKLPLQVVVADIASRATLYFTSAEATVAGIDAILEHLDRATAAMDVEPYPTAPSAPPVIRTPITGDRPEVPPAADHESTSVPARESDAETQQPSTGSSAGTHDRQPDVPLQLTPTAGPDDPVAPDHRAAEPDPDPQGTQGRSPTPQHNHEPPAPTGDAPTEDAALSSRTTSSAPPDSTPPTESSSTGDLALAGEE